VSASDGSDSDGDGTVCKPYATVSYADEHSDGADGAVLLGDFEVAGDYQFKASFSYTGFGDATTLSLDNGRASMQSTAFARLIINADQASSSDAYYTFKGNGLRLYNVVLEHEASTNGYREILYVSGCDDPYLVVENSLLYDDEYNALVYNDEGCAETTTVSSSVSADIAEAFTLTSDFPEVAVDDVFYISSSDYANSGYGVYSGTYGWKADAAFVLAQ